MCVSKYLPSHTKCHQLDLLDQLLLWQRGLDRFHLVSLILEHLLAQLVHVFEEQDLDVLCVERLQSLGCIPGSAET